MHFKSMMDTEYFYANDFCFMKYDDDDDDDGDDDDDDEDGELILWYWWFQPGPLPEILTISILRQDLNLYRTWVQASLNKVVK